jgi:hypothetical protein
VCTEFILPVSSRWTFRLSLVFYYHNNVVSQLGTCIILHIHRYIFRINAIVTELLAPSSCVLEFNYFKELCFIISTFLFKIGNTFTWY